MQTIYKDKKSNDIFKLWTSKYGTPHITRYDDTGKALINFEFSNIKERTEAINRAITKGSIYKIS